jgi:cytoskeletal protein CcmA (bactofilin family)
LRHCCATGNPAAQRLDFKSSQSKSALRRSCLVFGKRKSHSVDKIEAVIGPAASFNGHLKCDSSVRIDGLCEGTIETAGNVIIGEGAKVIADIIAENVSVSGAVKGNITARSRLEILPTGRVWADITVTSFLIDEEGFFRGEITMSGEPEPSLIEAPQPTGEIDEAAKEAVENEGTAEGP